MLRIETEALNALIARIDDHFAQACKLILACKGRLIVIGMGKSGHIGKKIAATLASTGTPAFFVHPGEASHGDLGMITREDVVLAISNSGTTDEILTILPIIRRLGAPLISMTGQPSSTLALAADIHLNVSVEKEACPLNLAPTASTTATLALGDALAVALLQARGFTAEDFARSHPSGRLGRRLILRVQDLMVQDDALPCVSPETLLAETLITMTQKGLGLACICDENRQLLGIYTDGDLRRTLNKQYDIQTTPVRDVMTTTSKSISQDALAAQALQLMETHKITSLVVLDSNQCLIGVIHMHHLLEAKVA